MKNINVTFYRGMLIGFAMNNQEYINDNTKRYILFFPFIAIYFEI